MTAYEVLGELLVTLELAFPLSRFLVGKKNSRTDSRYTVVGLNHFTHFQLVFKLYSDNTRGAMAKLIETFESYKRVVEIRETCLSIFCFFLGR